MRKLIILLAIILSLLWPTFALAWGPMAHEEIGLKVTQNITVNQTAFQVGVVFPDVSLARFDKKLTEQRMFHTPTYLANLKPLATTDELKSFVQGYECHLISDNVQNAYNVGKPISADTYVDALIGRSAITSISPTNAMADLMVAAWRATYPTYPWQPDRDWILSSTIPFNVYLSGFQYTQADRDLALQWFPDYRTYLELSVWNSLGIIRMIQGDANKDSLVNMADATTIERMILGLIPVNAEADANRNGIIDMGDVVKVERIILGI